MELDLWLGDRLVARAAHSSRGAKLRNNLEAGRPLGGHTRRASGPRRTVDEATLRKNAVR